MGRFEQCHTLWMSLIIQMSLQNLLSLKDGEHHPDNLGYVTKQHVDLVLQQHKPGF